MKDLFDLPPAGYPNTPGYKEKTTSRDAARKIEARAPTLRDQVRTIFRDRWPSGHTADEIADQLGKTEFAIRPRLSELRQTGDIVPTTVRRPNRSGVPAIVWVYPRNPDQEPK